MQKSFLLFLIFIFLFLGSFIVFFFISRTLIIESPENPSHNSNPILATNKEPLELQTIPDLKNDFIRTQKSFLEVNLPAKKVRLYQDGKLIKEAPILGAGDPQGWGGSAIGLYKIISGNKISFSVVAEVYMPYALH